jgi:tyrosyl-tRNA synthetase
MDRFLKANDNPTSFLEHLQARGLVQDFTPALTEYLKNCSAKGEVPRAYVGFDPSAPSLQVGNLMPAMLLRRAQLHGVQPIILVGGATGLIGDPSGKKEERNLQDKDVTAANLVKIQKQLENLIDFTPGRYQAKVVNNFDWFKDFRFLDFLRDVGRHITVNYMTAKDSVKIRMETGISYAEFGYMLIQGYDFLHLYEKEQCKIQLGGSDQWGNMTTGLELIRRKHGGEGYALSNPLLTDSAGNKLGKSVGGAIYLDAGMTSPFKFYQFWLGQADADVGKCLRFLTLLDDSYISELEDQVKAQPELRSAQKVLAHELTRMIHGEPAALASENASRVLFSKDVKVLESLSSAGLDLLAQEVPCTHFDGKEISILDMLVNAKLCASKGEARRHIKANAVTVNRVKLTDETMMVNEASFGGRRMILLGVGKSNLHLLLRG